ncbi:helix-turn-helix domain-containing protein [Prauserella oleivorans]|uniref:Helix-turn-helix domain-containing protein n=1 Tax=Prauserella oleivorans TaxID=1478153 RepID=A0ABW5WDJ8_9PSEU
MTRRAALIGPSAREELARLAPVFRQSAGHVAQRILQQIQRTIPEYARPLEGTFGKAIRDGVEQGVLEFLDRLLGDPAPPEGTGQLFRQLGKYEVAEGRGIEVLHSAFRIGARIGWQGLSEIGLRAGLPVATMCELAAALFAYMDELSELSHEGYAAAQARAAGALERRRKRLLELLLAEVPAPLEVLLDQSLAAGWPLPEEVAVAVVDAPDGVLDDPELTDDILVDLESDTPCLVLPVRAGEVPEAAQVAEVAEVGSALPGTRLVVGPAVPLGEARHSLRWARQLAALRDDGVVADRPVLRGEDHLLTLWLLAEPPLARRLVAWALDPLAGLTRRRRDLLAETLSAWLESTGSAPDVAARLDVHPQTVRHRLHQLDQHYGDRLRDADERLALAVALRARALLRTRPG